MIHERGLHGHTQEAGGEVHACHGHVDVRLVEQAEPDILDGEDRTLETGLDDALTMEGTRERHGPLGEVVRQDALQAVPARGDRRHQEIVLALVVPIQ